MVAGLSATDTPPTPPAASSCHPALRARFVFRMAEVIAAGQTEATSLADQAAEGEGKDEQPEDPGVKERVDGEARPDGEVSEKPIVLDHVAVHGTEHTHLRDRESGLKKEFRAVRPRPSRGAILG